MIEASILDVDQKSNYFVCKNAVMLGGAELGRGMHISGGARYPLRLYPDWNFALIFSNMLQRTDSI